MRFIRVDFSKLINLLSPFISIYGIKNSSLLLLKMDKYSLYFFKFVFLLSKFGNKKFNDVVYDIVMRCFFWVCGSMNGSLNCVAEFDELCFGMCRLRRGM